MKKTVIFLCAAVFFCFCAACSAWVTPTQDYDSSASSAATVPSSAPEKAVKALETIVYEREAGMTPEEIVEAYIAHQYLSYTELAFVDIGALLDMKLPDCESLLAWTKLLAMRRMLLAEEGLCYVQTEELPYTITFEDAPEYEEIERWTKLRLEQGGAVVYFRITGEAGKAYPPIMAMNAQHTMFFGKADDGEWQITRHYFPGSVRKFARVNTLEMPTEAEMLAQLEAEFSGYIPDDAPAVPEGAAYYGPGQAVDYAMRYTENKNPAFYDIGDWMGNCSNFVSQCLWAGFSDGYVEGSFSPPSAHEYMTSEWYGGDGGSPAWENVDYFWDYATGGASFGSVVLAGASELTAGDIIQTQPAIPPEEGDGESDDFNHMLLVVDGETLLLAQNSPGCFVYYADIVNVRTRMLRPVYLILEE